METKRLYRSRDHRVLGGVAGGIAAYFDIDPVFVRLGFVLLTIFNGIGALLYLALWLLVPNVDSTSIDSRSQVRENADEIRSTAESLVDRVRNAFNA